MSLIALSRAEVPATTMRATTAIQPWPWMSEPIVRPAAPPNTAAVPTRRSRVAYAPPLSTTMPSSPPMAISSPNTRWPDAIPARSISARGTGAGSGLTAVTSHAGTMSVSQPATAGVRSRGACCHIPVTTPSLAGHSPRAGLAALDGYEGKRPPGKGGSAARVGLLQRGDVELLHHEHGLGDPPHFLRVGIGDHVQEHGGEDLPGQPVLVHQPAARDFRAALGEPAPVVVHLGLVLARDHDRDRRVERVLRAAVQRDELLPVELELDSLDRTGGPRPCLGVAGHPSDLAVLEDAGVVVRRGLALGVEPQAGDERLVGHFSSPSLLFSSGY